MSNSLQPHGLQHARPLCPSPTLGVCSNSNPLSQWCHPTISSCCPLLLLPSIFHSIRVFSNESILCNRWPKYWSFSFSINTSNEHSGLEDWLILSPCSPRDSQESSPTPQFKALILPHSAFFIVQLSHPHMTTGKTVALTRWTFVGNVSAF